MAKKETEIKKSNRTKSKVLTKEEESVIKDVTSPENVEKIEDELKDTYKEDTAEQEKTLESITDDGEGEKNELDNITETLNDVNKTVEGIMQETDVDKIEDVMLKELEKLDKAEEQVAKIIEKADKTDAKAHKRIVNSRITSLWNGTRFT